MGVAVVSSEGGNSPDDGGASAAVPEEGMEIGCEATAPGIVVELP